MFFSKFILNLIAYINTTSRGIVHMKSFPSHNILNDPIKRNMINQLLTEVKLDLTSYMLILCNSIIKDKQILTANAIQMLLLPEHKLLYESLKQKYPDRKLDSMYWPESFNIISFILILYWISISFFFHPVIILSNDIPNSNNTNNHLLNDGTIINQPSNYETQRIYLKKILF